VLESTLVPCGEISVERGTRRGSSEVIGPAIHALLVGKACAPVADDGKSDR